MSDIVRASFRCEQDVDPPDVDSDVPTINYVASMRLHGFKVGDEWTAAGTMKCSDLVVDGESFPGEVHCVRGDVVTVEKTARGYRLVKVTDE